MRGKFTITWPEWPVAHTVHNSIWLQLTTIHIKPNDLIGIFTHLKLCLADTIHNFKWGKIIQFWQNGGQLFADCFHILFSKCLKGGTWCAIKKWKPEYMRTGG